MPATVPPKRLILIVVLLAAAAAAGCDLFEQDDAEDEPQDFAVLIENRSTTPLSIIVAPAESFSDESHLQAGQTRQVGVRGVRSGEVVFFEAAVRGQGIPWETIAVVQCRFDGDLDKFRRVFFLGGLGCENW